MAMINELRQYTAGDAYPFHMPGHKRNPAYFWADPSMDITEIDGFDDLHAPEGLIARLQQDLAQVYGAKESCLLVNGSTAGNLAAILGSTRPGDRILVAANCHKSVWNALCMQDVAVDVVEPRYNENGLWGVLSAEDVESALTSGDGTQISAQDGKSDNDRQTAENGQPKCAAVVITAPTYEGLMPEVAAIAETVHAHGAVLMVDAAHGAHFFDEHFPENPVLCGADLVVMSLHKTLPCYGQTAVLHICSDRVDGKRIAEWLGMIQTSSPSYLLMAQASACANWMKTKAADEMAAFSARLAAFREKAAAWKHLRLLPVDDASKLVISTAGTCVGETESDQNGQKTSCLQKEAVGIREPESGQIEKKIGRPQTAGAGFSGTELAERLRKEYHLEVEMAGLDYVLAMTSVCDTEEGFARLEKALGEIDASLTDGLAEASAEKKAGGFTETENAVLWTATGKNSPETKKTCSPVAESNAKQPALSCYQAFHAQGEWVLLSEAEGRIARRGAFIYPPGIPSPAPGECISREQIERLAKAASEGLTLRGIVDGKIECVIR